MILFPIRLTHFFTAISLLFVCAVFPIWSQDVGDPLIADFRYPPEWWQTSICLPDDWQKTLVGKDGSLLYDHPGKFNSFKTKITAEAAGKIEWVSQELASPRFPLVQTVKRNGPIEITEEAFTIAPPFIERLIPGVDAVVIESIGKKTVLTHWAQPPQDVDPAFRHIEVAYVKPLRYRFKALPDTDYTVVFGLCEGFHDEGGIRILDLMVEGTVAQNVDMVAGKGRNVPALFAFPAIDGNGDGYIDLAVKPNIESSDANSFLNVLWVFQGTDIPPLDRLMTGEVISEALAYRDCGFRLPDGSPRQDMLIVRYRNVGVRSATAVPAITIQSELDVAPNESKTRMIFNQWNQVVFSQPFEKIERTDTTSRLRFAPIGLPSGESHVLKAVVKRGKFAVNIPFEPYYIDFLKRRSEAYWRERDLPYGHIQIPDPTIQALLDSSIRNIYQAREIKKGLPAFQVGPTVYRGLWVVDGAFILESIAYLNRVEEARAGIDYLLAFQREDGAFMLIDGHWKETGIVLWAVTRHARLTHDKPWLESVWPRVERGFAYIQSMRAMPDPSALNARLIPEGFSDGGLAGRYPEYTNVYWTMTGLKAAADAARWLDKGEQAEIWQEEYDDFYKTFRNAAERDMSTDDQGNTFLPTRMRDDQNVRKRLNGRFFMRSFPETCSRRMIHWFGAIWRCFARPNVRGWCGARAGCRRGSGIISRRFTETPGSGLATGARREKVFTPSPTTPHRCCAGARNIIHKAKERPLPVICRTTGPAPSLSA